MIRTRNVCSLYKRKIFQAMFLKEKGNSGVNTPSKYTNPGVVAASNASENETFNSRKQLCGNRRTIRNNVQSIIMNWELT